MEEAGYGRLVALALPAMVNEAAAPLAALADSAIVGSGSEAGGLRMKELLGLVFQAEREREGEQWRERGL